MDGCLSKLVNVVTGVPQGIVWGPSLFFLYTSVFFSNLDTTLIVYADDATSMAAVSSPGFRVTAVEFLIRDLGRVSEWGDFWGTIIWRNYQLLAELLTIGGTVLKESNDLVILGVTFDSKMTFEKHLRSVPEQLLKDLVS